MNLYLTIGVPGAGKSFWACSQHNKIVISSDGLRAQLGQDESDQSVSARVFDTMEIMAEYFIRQDDWDVIIDATNVKKKARKRFLDLARRYGVYTVAVVFPLDVALAKLRNKKRGRNVPEDVIDRMAKNYAAPTDEEFDEIMNIFASPEKCEDCSLEAF